MDDNDIEAMRELCRGDLFFLLLVVCKRKDVDHDWLYERCREVEVEPDGRLDLWSRFHFKSSIITFALTIQTVLRDPDECVGIFSHTRPIAKKFLFQIKNEFEVNTFLKDLFPEILYADPVNQSPRWSLDGGIIVQRKSNPKEATIEAWGLVDGQPTGAHFTVMVYDDVVTRESVTTPDMIEKTNDALALSLNLEGRRNGRPPIKRFVGTHYHQMDTYKMIIQREIAIPRYNYPTDMGKDDIEVDGKPFLLSTDELKKHRKSMGPYIYSSQMLLNPSADKSQGFKGEWLMYYDNIAKVKGNYYILVDSANSKKKNSDYTVIVVICLSDDGNYYLVDGVRDRMNLTERTRKLIDMHRKWRPIAVGYERYGKDSDIEHINYTQDLEGYRFKITELGGSVAKNDRIRKLIPIFENYKFYLPRRLLFSNIAGEAVDFVHDFVADEYFNFPVAAHDDMLDCIARIVDENLAAKFPSQKKQVESDIALENLIRTYHPIDSMPNNTGSSTNVDISKIGFTTWKDLMRIH